MLERNNANSNGMIVHWFIEAVCGGKESAFDIETPFHSNNMQQNFSPWRLQNFHCLEDIKWYTNQCYIEYFNEKLIALNGCKLLSQGMN